MSRKAQNTKRNATGVNPEHRAANAIRAVEAPVKAAQKVENGKATKNIVLYTSHCVGNAELNGFDLTLAFNRCRTNAHTKVD
eukprot:CAMPEP_0170438624 /NCGR_PEP_ID=MMETSP0117_2-20130122/45340_1 /TAXON_ID=400756 /ORGANISM="Durinskia baltica, Strain CSIRO CS-38" /LENGTH=81 /DNA_ID=CAMNT_0010698871 /DNA_START=130 /DNA_END=372 /DNA_ORIENTATION=+